jgi:hypothetical protein
MARSADPQGGPAEPRAATIERLAAYGIPRDWAERWITDYELRVDIRDVRGAPTYWEDAYDEVIEQYVGGHQPPPALDD